MQSATAIKIVQFKGDGFKMLAKRYCGARYEVARRFPVFVLNGPEIKPSISGIIADDVINIANSIKTYHKEKESIPLSIGLERVFGLYNKQEKKSN